MSFVLCALALANEASASCMPAELREYAPVIDAASELYAVPAELLWAVFYTESRGNHKAKSRAGAVGVSQLMPRTARSQGVWDRANPFQSILGGTRYLRLQINRFRGNLSLALAAYNAGPGAVEKYGGIPPFAETQRYVPKVLRRFWNFQLCAKGEVQ